MMQQKVTVHYEDGVTEDVVLTQWALAQFDRWAARNGYAPSKAGRALIQELPVLWLRVGAWATLMRDVKTKTAFDAWDATVIEVEVHQAETPDPTQPDTPAEPSPE